MKLRPRQEQAIADLRRSFQTKHRAPILLAPTAFGKTATSTVMIKTSIEKGLRVWFMAHLKEILDSTASALTNSGIRYGYIWAGHLADRRQQVQVVSVQSAARRLDRLEKPDLIIVDEAHLAVAKTYQDVFEWANAGPKYWKPGGALLLHLTATPKRLDGRGMGEVADDIVYTCSTQEMIDEGLAPPVRYLTPDMPDSKEFGHIGGDFNPKMVAAVMDKPAIVGSALDLYMRMGRGRPGLGFCANIASARNYAERFAAAGLRTMAISGDDHDAQRDLALQGIQNGKLDFVFNCKLWVAGVDAPAISYIADLAPTESLTRYLQGLGRGLRNAPGKSDLIYADHSANMARHGNPLAPREWSLAADPEKQSRASKYEIGEKKCPACLASVSSIATHCKCGHEFVPQGREIEEIDGELREVDLAEAARAQQIERRREQGQAQTEQDLIQIGRQRGMARPELWARHVLRARIAKESRGRV